MSIVTMEAMARMDDAVVELGQNIDDVLETVLSFFKLYQLRYSYVYSHLDNLLVQADGLFELDLSQSIKTRSQHVMFWFGVSTLFLGFFGLVFPQFMLISLGAPFVPAGEKRPFYDFTFVFIRMSAVAAINMGAYYVFAALSNNRSFFVPTVPFRIFTLTVFSTLALTGAAPSGIFGIALWEGGGALWLAHALAAEVVVE